MEHSAYDADGNATKTIDGDGHTTLTSYDADGNVLKTVDGDAKTTLYAYDADGNQTKVIDPDGNTTTSAYDAAGQLISTTDPKGNVTTYAYDGAGNQTLVTLPNGDTIQSSYDSDNQKVFDSDAQGFDLYLRDPDGNETMVLNAAGAYQMSYDAAGRVTKVVEPSGVTLLYGYDGVGNQTSVTDSFGGVQTSTYNLEDQLVSRSYVGLGQTLLVDWTYNDEGQIATESRFSDLAGTTEQYDGNGNVTSIENTNGSGGIIDQFQYSYDAAGNLAQEVDNGVTTVYTYDADNQLTGAGAAGYTYDANGNRASGGDVIGADNQLLSDGMFTYTYNTAGDETSKYNASVTWTYGYDDKNELTSAEETATSTGAVLMQESNEYDAFGNLIEQETYLPATGTTVTKFALDGWNPAMLSGGVGNENFNVWGVLDGNSNLVTRNLFGDQVDQPLARIDQAGASDAAGAYWLLTDHLGSVRDVLDHTGVEKESIAYDAYGNITSESGATFRGMYSWTGRQVDVETGLQYNRARWYDAATGRWISQDPMGFDAGDSNLYRYVNNAPTSGGDPNGMDPPSSMGLVSPQAKKARNPNLEIDVELHVQILMGGSNKSATNADPFATSKKAESQDPAQIISQGLNKKTTTAWVEPPRMGQEMTGKPLGVNVTIRTDAQVAFDKNVFEPTVNKQIAIQRAAWQDAESKWDSRQMKSFHQDNGEIQRLVSMSMDPGRLSVDFRKEPEDYAKVVAKNAMHVAQVAGGAGEIIVGIPTSLSGFGVIAVAHGADNVFAGICCIITQEEFDTFTSKGLASGAKNVFNASDKTANIIGKTGDAAIGIFIVLRPDRMLNSFSPRQYSVAFETRLNIEAWGMSHSTHVARAEASLQQAMRADADLAKMMDELLSEGRFRWHHATIEQSGGTAGVMQLVPLEQHTRGSQWYRLLHTGPRMSGGYQEWAIPMGAPKR